MENVPSNPTPDCKFTEKNLEIILSKKLTEENLKNGMEDCKEPTSMLGVVFKLDNVTQNVWRAPKTCIVEPLS